MPALQAEIERKIQSFIKNPAGRTKAAVSALGEWLPLLSVSKKYNWSSVAIPYIHGIFSFLQALFQSMVLNISFSFQKILIEMDCEGSPRIEEVNHWCSRPEPIG